MSIGPLLSASVAIQVHAFAALAALAIGTMQLLMPKGTRLHRCAGLTWVLLMLAVAVSSFWIQGIRQIGPFSLIHLLSIWTLVAVPAALIAARRGHISMHRKAMISLYFGALIVAGALTLLPGRLMHQVVLGP